MALPVAGRAAGFEFCRDGVAGDAERRHVIELDEAGFAALDARMTVDLRNDPLLASRGVASPVAGVDRSPRGVVEQQADEGVVQLGGDGVRGDGRAVIEGVAVASNMDDHFGGERDSEIEEQHGERIGLLLGQGGERPFIAGSGLPPPSQLAQRRGEGLAAN